MVYQLPVCAPFIATFLSKLPVPDIENDRLKGAANEISDDQTE
jgi:hypothetical protein